MWVSLGQCGEGLRHMLPTLTIFLPPVSLESKSSVAKFPVTISYPVMPRLYDPGPGKALVPGAAWWDPVELLVTFRSPLRWRRTLDQNNSPDNKLCLEENNSRIKCHNIA